MDIDPSDTLQYASAREHDDERHICPLQLEVIRRGVELWTNPTDIVLSPFAGIGSEGYVTLQMGRRFVGAELKNELLPAGGPEPRNGNARDGRHVRSDNACQQVIKVSQPAQSPGDRRSLAAPRNRRAGARLRKPDTGPAARRGYLRRIVLYHTAARCRTVTRRRISPAMADGRLAGPID